MGQSARLVGRIAARHADADAILCVGATEAAEVSRRFPSKRVEYMPNGVDFSRFSRGNGPRFRDRFGIPSSAKLLAVVGRIDPQKNQMLAVEALAALSAESHLALVGHVTSPDYLAQLRKTVEEKGLRQRVTIIEGLGQAGGDIVDAYHAADLVLVPSVHEPFGIVVP